MSTSTVTLLLTVDISTPAPAPGADGFLRGSKITVEGIASCDKHTTNQSPPLPGEEPLDPVAIEPSPESITGVSVRLSASGSFVPATATGPLVGGKKLFTSWETVLLDITGVVNDTLEITARVTAGAQAATDTITIKVDRTPPALDITKPQPRPDDPTAVPKATKAVDANNAAVFRVEGTVSDERSSVAKVEFAVESGAYQPAALGTKDGTGRHPWTADITISGLGTRRGQIRATDSEGNATIKLVDLETVATLRLVDQDEPFGAINYLDDLLKFANRRMVEVSGTTVAPLTEPNLTGAYFQPFAALLDPAKREPARQPISQTRACIEVVRRFLKGKTLSAEAVTKLGQIETSYRQWAYVALLRHLGTSADEINRARGDSATKSRLAERLGLDHPDRLDSLLLTSITEKELERTFGLTDSMRDVVEAALPPAPLLLTWQLDRLRGRWRVGDDASRAFGDVPRPVIDPDLLGEDDFRVRESSDPAYSLWTQRRNQIAADITGFQQLRQGKSPLEGFHAVVGTHVAPAAELQALLEDHRRGKDIVAALAAKRLTLEAFLRLMRCHELAAGAVAGVGLTPADLADVDAIAVQVRKIRVYYPAWRKDEGAGMTLSPDYFAVPAATTPRPALPKWQATARDRRDWEETLRARTRERQAVVEGWRALIDAVEQETLPDLGNALVDAARKATTAVPSVDGLLIELAAGPTLKTTRLAQAIETLQTILFTARMGGLRVGTVDWRLTTVNYSEVEFDADWQWFGSHDTWRAAMRAFAHPESRLLPTLRPAGPEQTEAWKRLLSNLRAYSRVTPRQVRAEAAAYLTQVRTELPPKSADPTQDPYRELRESATPAFVLTDELTDVQLAARQSLCRTFFTRLLPPGVTDPQQAPKFLEELFYFVPLLCALQLQRSGEYLAALDWLQTVYAYHLPPGKVPGSGTPESNRRKIYHGLLLEESITTTFTRPENWPRVGLDPYQVAPTRKNALTRIAVITVAGCLLEFADSEFTKDTDESVARARTLYKTALELLDTEVSPPTGTAPGAEFGPDPAVAALRRRATSNLDKIRLGRNISGLERLTALDLAGATPVAPRQPTPYRYAVLVARAKELAQLAGQMEAAMLAALEKSDAEAYTLLRANQDIALAEAGKILKDEQVTVADDAIALATLQEARAEIQEGHFQELLIPDVPSLEVLEFLGLFGSMVSATVSAMSAGPEAGFIAGVGSMASGFASLERRRQEWELQHALAQQDVAIGAQQVLAAQHQRDVVLQEQAIAQLQVDHANATKNFLARKFTGPELYEFMSQLLAGVYRELLQHATAMAKLAEAQLAFERQQASPGVIRADYWEAPVDGFGASGGGPDRRGLTGSARLLGDIVELDQQAFLTDRRKLQLSKTISLARVGPVAFARFRRTGVMVFATPQELFDRDHPGHYLRLVKRVRASFIALVPPTEGIHATLSTPGISRVVIGNGVAGGAFRTAVVRREPEIVALSSPHEATGLFELLPDSQPEMLLPFEGGGVDTVWHLELPRPANLFDFDTIADVLVTIDYTALHSADYRRQVIQSFAARLSLERPFSFRHELSDEWYDLHNPDQTATPMTVRFTTSRAEFAPNLDDLAIEQVSLFVASVDGSAAEIEDLALRFTPSGASQAQGGTASTIEGLVSTRLPNGENWRSMAGRDRPPFGTWELTLPDKPEVRELFKNEQVADILFVITYAGRTPEWPA